MLTFASEAMDDTTVEELDFDQINFLLALVQPDSDVPRRKCEKKFGCHQWNMKGDLQVDRLILSFYLKRFDKSRSPFAGWHALPH